MGYKFGFGQADIGTVLEKITKAVDYFSIDSAGNWDMRLSGEIIESDDDRQIVRESIENCEDGQVAQICVAVSEIAMVIWKREPESYFAMWFADVIKGYDSYLSWRYLAQMHGISEEEAKSLLIFSIAKTIRHKECYGDGSTIFPEWKESQTKNNVVPTV